MHVQQQGLKNLYNKAKHTTISHGRYAGSSVSPLFKAKYFWSMGDRYRQVPLYWSLWSNSTIGA